MLLWIHAVECSAFFYKSHISTGQRTTVNLRESAVPIFISPRPPIKLNISHASRALRFAPTLRASNTLSGSCQQDGRIISMLSLPPLTSKNLQYGTTHDVDNNLTRPTVLSAKTNTRYIVGQTNSNADRTCPMKLPMEAPRSAQATPEISSHITRISPPAPPPAAAGEDDVALGVGTTGGVDTSSPLRPSDSRKRRGYVIGIGRGVDTEYEQPEPTPEWWRTCCVQSTCRVHEGNQRQG